MNYRSIGAASDVHHPGLIFHLTAERLFHTLGIDLFMLFFISQFVPETFLCSYWNNMARHIKASHAGYMCSPQIVSIVLVLAISDPVFNRYQIGRVLVAQA